MTHAPVSPRRVYLHPCAILQMRQQCRWEVSLTPARFRPFLLFGVTEFPLQVRSWRGPTPVWLRPLA